MACQDCRVGSYSNGFRATAGSIGNDWADSAAGEASKSDRFAAGYDWRNYLPVCQSVNWSRNFRPRSYPSQDKKPSTTAFATDPPLNRPDTVFIAQLRSGPLSRFGGLQEHSGLQRFTKMPSLRHGCRDSRALAPIVPGDGRKTYSCFWGSVPKPFSLGLKPQGCSGVLSWTNLHMTPHQRRTPTTTTTATDELLLGRYDPASGALPTPTVLLLLFILARPLTYCGRDIWNCSKVNFLFELAVEASIRMRIT